MQDYIVGSQLENEMGEKNNRRGSKKGGINFTFLLPLTFFEKQWEKL